MAFDSIGGSGCSIEHARSPSKFGKKSLLEGFQFLSMEGDRRALYDND